jgi:hypothetical protein
MSPALRLYEDTIAGGTRAVTLAARPRMIFIVHGAATIDGKAFVDGEAWHGEGTASLAPGAQGVTCWRFELAPPGGGGSAAAGPGVTSTQKLSALLDTMPKGELLMRGDSVAFPPGGCAFLHRHWGPGIRCLLEGGIRIDTHGRSTSYGPGAAWYETGVDPVFAQAAADRPTRFIRVMILPRELLGQSSFRFVNEEDKAKPRVQQYKIFVDAPIAAPAVAGP